MSAFRSIIRTTTTYGPVVITPEEDVPPPDYTPSLQGWLIPETGRSSVDTIALEDVWLEVCAFGKGLARHHHTKVVIRIIGKYGPSFLVQTASGVTLILIANWLTQ
jgi:hypothetical protein